MRRHAAAIGLVLVVLVATWAFYAERTLRDGELRAESVAAASSAASNAQRAPEPASATKKDAYASGEARAKRDALHREIARHVAGRAGATGTSVPSRAEPEAPASDPKRASNEAPKPTDLRNKLGPGREKLVEFLNEELSPLLAECVEQAEARAPTLSGMFAIGIETLAHEELGAVVDVADPAASNKLSDPVFFECVRESAFTLIIPPPLTTGQEKFELTGYRCRTCTRSPAPARRNAPTWWTPVRPPRRSTRSRRPCRPFARTVQFAEVSEHVYRAVSGSMNRSSLLRAPRT